MRSGCLTLHVTLTAVESTFLAAVFPFLLLHVDVAFQPLGEPAPPAVFEFSFVPPVAAGFSFALLAVFEFSFVLLVVVESFSAPPAVVAFSFVLLVVVESFSAPPAVVAFSFVLLGIS